MIRGIDHINLVRFRMGLQPLPIEKELTMKFKIVKLKEPVTWKPVDVVITLATRSDAVSLINLMVSNRYVSTELYRELKKLLDEGE